MELTRRMFLSRSIVFGLLMPAHGTLPILANESESSSDRGITVDSLCYFTFTKDWNADDISDATRKATAAGLTAVVFDAIFPRQFNEAVYRFADWGDLFSRPNSPVFSIVKAEDFKQAKKKNKLGVVLACQDASILESPGRATQNLEMFYSLGLRVLQLTHNVRTQWGDSCLEGDDGGLSRAGEQLVSTMNRLGMIVDLSHCSHKTLMESVSLSTKPCAVTHAGCKALAPTARNKSDEEIRALGAMGGYFGVFNQLNWLTNKPGGNINVLLDHIDHAVQLIGPDQVGFGSDGYVSQLDAAVELKGMQEYQKRQAGRPTLEWAWDIIRVPELNSPNRLQVLAEALASRGYKDHDIQGIVGANFVRFFERVCG